MIKGGVLKWVEPSDAVLNNLNKPKLAIKYPTRGFTPPRTKAQVGSSKLENTSISHQTRFIDGLYFPTRASAAMNNASGKPLLPEVLKEGQGYDEWLRS
ncbi:hypothetical protein [Yersinia kristensenii]|uniref:hypothetical protein n=1 Tax=Yersinia kristensenii TaxID=28152 RepID=UPI00067B4C98|nr:hypothetical protein [Yersinia kristensenii]